MNDEFIKEFRANGGKMSGPLGSMELLLLKTTGAKSGKEYVNPLAYSKDGDKYVIIASKAGAPSNPDWYYNVIANPNVSIEVGSEEFTVKATEVKDEERQRLYDRQADMYPNFKEYAAKTIREIPVFILEKI